MVDQYKLQNGDISITKLELLSCHKPQIAHSKQSKCDNTFES